MWIQSQKELNIISSTSLLCKGFRMRMAKLVTSIVFIILLIAFQGCDTPKTTTTNDGNVFSSAIPSPMSTDKNKAEVLLLSGGYGYLYGDIVLLDITTTPKIGDIILYDWRVNKSDFQAFGSQYQLVKVIALSGDNVIFERWSYKANSYDVVLQQHNTPETTNVIWGTVIYGDVSGLTLQVPSGEYLGDRWIGREGRQEDFGKPNYFGYNRFTIKIEAISGVVIKKIGHKDIPQITY